MAISGAGLQQLVLNTHGGTRKDVNGVVAERLRVLVELMDIEGTEEDKRSMQGLEETLAEVLAETKGLTKDTILQALYVVAAAYSAPD